MYKTTPELAPDMGLGLSEDSLSGEKGGVKDTQKLLKDA